MPVLSSGDNDLLTVVTVMVRAAGLRGLAELIEELGGDAEALLGRFGVPVAILGSEDGLISARVAGEVLETVAAELDCPDLGLRLAARQNAEVLGCLSAVIRNSLTVGDALDCITEYLYVHSPSLAITAGEAADRRDLLELRLDCVIGPLLPQVAGLGLGLLHRVLELVSGGDYGLRAVHLGHLPPATLAHYAEFFGTEVLARRRTTGLRLVREATAVPVVGADPFLRDAVREYMRNHFAQEEPILEQQVLGLLGQSIGTAPPSLPQIARQLRTHPRTMERRLSEAGTTFGALRDEVRRDAAYHLITAGESPLGEVAVMLGLTDQSSLTRAVRRWFGTSPLQLRRSRQPTPRRRSVARRVAS